MREYPFRYAVFSLHRLLEPSPKVAVHGKPACCPTRQTPDYTCDAQTRSRGAQTHAPPIAAVDVRPIQTAAQRLRPTASGSSRPSSAVRFRAQSAIQAAAPLKERTFVPGPGRTAYRPLQIGTTCVLRFEWPLWNDVNRESTLRPRIAAWSQVTALESSSESEGDIFAGMHGPCVPIW